MMDQEQKVLKEDRLSEEERLVLKGEKKIGYAFSLMVLAFCALYNLYHFVMLDNSENRWVVYVVDAGALSLVFLIPLLINRHINRDLKMGSKVVLKKVVDKRQEDVNFEAGSGSLYIPILGDRFPKLWGQPMREQKRYSVFADDTKFDVEKTIYDSLQEGKEFYVHMGKCSEIVLRITLEP